MEVTIYVPLVTWATFRAVLQSLAIAFADPIPLQQRGAGHRQRGGDGATPSTFAVGSGAGRGPGARQRCGRGFNPSHRKFIPAFVT